MLWLYLLGIMFTIAAIYGALRIYFIKQNGVKSNAVVVRIEIGNIRPITYHPVIQYRYRGEVIEKRYYLGDTQPKYKNRERVRIMHSKYNPKQFVIISDTHTN